jgi:flagellar basal body-associated protein FliL
VHKVKLDILENLPDIDITDAVVEPGESAGVELPVGGQRWAFNKLLLIGAPLLIIFLLSSGLLWFYLGTKVASPHQSPAPALGPKAGNEAMARTDMSLPAAKSVKINKISFNDFIINLKDKAGRSRILLCDVVLDVDEKNIAQLGRGQNVRNLIYQTARGKNTVALKSLDERKRLKNELAVELNKMFGEGIVRNVYFTSFIIM